MAIQEDPPPSIPEWVVTYGDMMSLLLTFFIMLAGMSEIKKNEKFQGVADAMEQHFGFDQTQDARVPGEYEIRRTEFSELTAAGRDRKDRWREGGNKRRSTPGESSKVTNVRQSETIVPSAIVSFGELDCELTRDAKENLAHAMKQLIGKPQKIELRGHTTFRPLAGTPYRDHIELGLERARVVERYLITEYNIEPRRLRVSSVGFYEPLTLDIDPTTAKKNARVEVIGLTELVNEFHGEAEDREKIWVE